MGRFRTLYSRIIFLRSVNNGLKISHYIGKRYSATKGTFKIGEKAALLRVFDQNEVNLYAELTGDRNPIHTDIEFAKSTRLGRCVVHGALING